MVEKIETIEYKVKASNGDSVYISIIENNPGYGLSIRGIIGNYSYQSWGENGDIVDFIKRANYSYFWGCLDPSSYGLTEATLNSTKEIKELFRDIKNGIKTDEYLYREEYEFLSEINGETLRESLYRSKPETITDECLIYMDSDKEKDTGCVMIFDAVHEVLDYIISQR